MENLFDKLAEQIHLPAEVLGSPAFVNADIDKVEVHTESRLWHFFLAFEHVLPAADFKLLSDLLTSGFTGIADTRLTVVARSAREAYSNEELNAYYQLIFDYPECASPSFTNIFKKFKLVQKGDRTLKLMVTDLPQIDRLASEHLPIINALFQEFGFKDLEITAEVDEVETEKEIAAHEALVEKQLSDASLASLAESEPADYPEPAGMSSSEPVPTKKVNPAKKAAKGQPKTNGLSLGREIKLSEKTTPMISAENPERGIIFEGYVFKAEKKEFTNRTTKKVSQRLDIYFSDYTTSFNASKWARAGESEIFDNIVDAQKKGLWVRIKGNLEMDNFKHELVLQIQSLQEIAAKNIRTDKAPDDEKRVEFHTHTIMSTMDATVTATELVEQAAKWGHKAIAITDHANAQSYPEAHKAGKKNGVQIIYGVEANLVEDKIPIVFNEEDRDLFEETYVIFDVETTGLSAVHNDLIQIAATKMHKGNPIDSFAEFIDPGYPLSSFTTELTRITDDDVAGSKPLKQVLEEFQAFCGNDILVAHNATFDYGFMNLNYEKNGLPRITQPVIDTLEFARNLLPDLKRYGLGQLTKKFNINLGAAHHRADSDAEATGRLYYAFLEELRLYFPDIKNLLQLNAELVAADSYKKVRPNHITLYAQTQDGLKNIFKLISYSNIDYFADVPRIPRSVLQANRKDVLVGSACSTGEVFDSVMNKIHRETLEIAKFYDFIEVMPPALYEPLLAGGSFKNSKEVEETIKELIQVADALNIPVVATGDVHYLAPEDEIYREIIVRSLAGAEINWTQGHGEDAKPLPLPKAHFRTTDEMLKDFAFLGEDLAKKIVVTNTRALAERFEVLTPVRDDLYTPVMTFEGGEGSEERIIRLAYEKAHEIYGDPLPDEVDERLEKELRSIVGNGFSVIYIIAQELVHRSNERGYLVGSRGSVGSSLVATMIGITEVNPLAPHYICPNKQCLHFEIFTDGTYGSGFDMPDKLCPDCGEKLVKNGQDIPFETFLGFKGDKVPDIDLNFSGDDQPYAHLDVRDIFGEEYAFRAGTIGTVAEKTAYGFVKGYERDYGNEFHPIRNAEVERLASGITGVKRTTGQHAGGIIVIPSYMDVYDFTPIQYPADDVNATWKTTHFDFHAIHDNILKLDILGHDDPTMIRMLQNLSGMDPMTIPFDDKDVLALFTGPEVLGLTKEQEMADLGTFGIPEMGTFTSMNMIAEAKPKTFADLLQISGLSHGTDVWKGNAQDLIKSGVATLSTVIGCRDDIMTYLIHKGCDEGMSFQIMEKVRKGMWMKLPDEERESYVTEMKAHGVPNWYIESCSKIKYMFPKAHATAYIMMALRVAWFKVHQPMYYYAAWFSIRAKGFDLSLMSGPLNVIKERIKDIRRRSNDRENPATNLEKDLLPALEICNEMRERGFNFGKIDLYESQAKDFVIEGNTLIPPFVVMDALGETAAESVVEARQGSKFLSKNDLKQKTKLTQTNIDALTDLGTLSGLPEDNQLDLFEMF
ncbi:MAG: PolC-type DNA polymerase III [Streptococcaceae bacterium]|jgi:DNA polymerase-3 subunit alpha (Gram-positive type)|nr:PolC-type DNA polymerase III [Streptococcaceae bacterium]